MPALLRVGLDAAAQDLDGETPLRLAVLAGAVDAVDALLHAGAPVDARNFDGDTALDAAMAAPDRKLRERLTVDCSRRAPLRAGSSQSSPRKPTRCSSARPTRLRRAMPPGFVRCSTRSRRWRRRGRPVPHRATLLHYCGANGVEEQRQTPAATDPELARLLDRGADPNATCLLYGGGATALGLVLSSVHPVRAGSRRQLAAVLLRAGARLDGNPAHGSLSAMAALGELDNLRQRLDSTRASASRLPNATHVQAAFWWACRVGRTDVADCPTIAAPTAARRTATARPGSIWPRSAVGSTQCSGCWRAGRRSKSRTRRGGTPLGNVLWAAVHHDPNVDYTPIVAAFVEAGAAVDPRYLQVVARKQDVLTPLSKPQIKVLLRGQV